MRRLALIGWLIAAPACAQGFLDRIPDLPLMSGLEEVPADGFLFDNPSGRIVEAVATGKVDPGAVTSFYRTTLAELGWTPAGGALAFRREGERLAIRIEGAGPARTVRFTITPDAQ